MLKPNLHILFHVPEGLEQIAIVDLKETILPFELADPLATIFIAEERTGRVHLFTKLQQQHDTKLWLQFLIHVPLLSVYHMTIITSTTVVPFDIYHDTHADALGQFVFDATKEIPWSDYIPNMIKRNNDSVSSTTPTFRATFYKDQLQHSTKSQALSGWMGYAYSQLFPDWKVNLTKYDYDVVAVWGRSRDTALLGHFGIFDIDDNDDGDDKNEQQLQQLGPILLYIGFDIPIPDTKYRNRVLLGRTSLNPPIAFCLVRLACPLPGQIILDMCCGTATIPIEGASKYPDTLWIGGEVVPKTLCIKAKENRQHAGVQNVELILSDSRRLNFRPECIDTVISDWPWGVREGSYSTITKLYPKFMRQLGKVLRQGGKAYIVSQGNKLMQRTLDYDWVQKMFSIEESLPIAIGGLGVCVYILKKK
ncbi:S-adenosyl-L-methionine-dependent methyltransferase [Halteromyces radiatus]|uniref:S-adenosyl-L-methionine-dependent methyltransferase n=1 Tax=Halteromyces radiatus TaxID=101107 RepID=UPI00221F60F9|nr:S-adenosyl-L-methionine-dependent methyltransferase [Halteromyces radiatus]KAI8081539.1 S-adenosyl-L-methionine-dependent methyltransferase [Halteromyces radiatus]